MRLNLPSSPPVTKPVGVASGASERMAPSCASTVRQEFAIGNVHEAQRAVAEGEGKRCAGAVEAGGDNEGVKFVLGAAGFEQEPGDGFAHCAAPPPPNPLPQGEGEYLGAARLTASINRTTLEAAPQPRPVQVAPDEHDPAYPWLALLPRPDEVAIGDHVHGLEGEPPVVVRV